MAADGSYGTLRPGKTRYGVPVLNGQKATLTLVRGHEWPHCVAEQLPTCYCRDHGKRSKALLSVRLALEPQSAMIFVRDGQQVEGLFGLVLEPWVFLVAGYEGRQCLV